ncbi:glycosyltransferase [Corynebacterium glutamicum]|uniref:glycosyltransferase family 4 protein n=1 Tax=Corynebacterium glutamicum TaxID=1718 RepID=UPI000979E82A|nr:glycosyltransferase family 4 protein [Corynebacterium glutamicum]GAV96131.1 glycosyltransferase [Corynebacterium glutamicum]
MKILVLSQHWHPENGVHQRRWTWLSELLMEAGNEVTVICPPPHDQRKIGWRAWLRSIHAQRKSVEVGPAGERIIRCLYLPAGRSLLLRALNQGVVAAGMFFAPIQNFKYFCGFKPDLVIGTVPAIPTALMTPVIAKFLKSPYVIDLRDAWPDLLASRDKWNDGTGLKSGRASQIGAIPMRVLSVVLTSMMHCSYRHARGMIVTSQDLAEDLQNKAAQRGRNLIITTIRNVFPPQTAYSAYPRPEGESGVLNVLYAGTLGRAQKLGNALDAVKLAREQGVQINLRFVGAGVSRDELLRKITEEKITAEIYGRVPAEELRDHYNWADTALVHLTNWEPLKRAIPSKTYELMTSGIHITGVVDGEAADLIAKLDAGHVVAPEDPAALASLWVELSQHRDQLAVSRAGKEWVEHQRNQKVPRALFSFLSKIGLG